MWGGRDHRGGFIMWGWEAPQGRGHYVGVGGKPPNISPLAIAGTSNFSWRKHKSTSHSIVHNTKQIHTYLAKLAFRELLIVTKDLCSMEYTDLQLEAVTHKLLHKDL